MSQPSALPSADPDPPDEPPLLTLAVLPGPAARKEALRQQLSAAGHYLAADPDLQAARCDRATVWRAIPHASIPVRVGQLVAEQHATHEQQAAHALLIARILHYGTFHRVCSFQPVWDIVRLDPLGLELYVADDDDATHQLHSLARALGAPRSQLNIKPRAGWQHYGY